jgi:site-specific DNA recombinase
MLAFLRERREPRPVILVEKTDRLYRNLKDWVLLDELNLDIHLVKEGTVLSDESRSSEKFIHGIKVLMAKNYIDNLSEEVRKGMHQKAAGPSGPARRRSGTRTSDGWTARTSSRSTSKVAPKVAAVFQAYASGDFSLTELAKYADKIGLRSKKGNKVQRSSLHQMLRNPLYIGEFDWHGTTYTAKHQPLVSRELFEKVRSSSATGPS